MVASIETLTTSGSSVAGNWKVSHCSSLRIRLDHLDSTDRSDRTDLYEARTVAAPNEANGGLRRMSEISGRAARTREAASNEPESDCGTNPTVFCAG